MAPSQRKTITAHLMYLFFAACSLSSLVPYTLVAVDDHFLQEVLSLQVETVQVICHIYRRVIEHHRILLNKIFIIIMILEEPSQAPSLCNMAS